jgi:hypothetical protein
MRSYRKDETNDAADCRTTSAMRWSQPQQHRMSSHRPPPSFDCVTTTVINGHGRVALGRLARIITTNVRLYSIKYIFLCFHDWKQIDDSGSHLAWLFGTRFAPLHVEEQGQSLEASDNVGRSSSLTKVPVEKVSVKQASRNEVTRRSCRKT